MSNDVDPQAGQPLRGLIEEMVATSDALSAGADPQARLRIIVSRAREVTAATYGALSIFDDEGRAEQFIFEGMDEHRASTLGALPTGRGLLGLLAERREPLRLDDLRSHPSFTGWPEGHPEMAAFIGTPLRAAGVTIGSLYLTRAEGEPPFEPANELAATMLGLQASAVAAMAVAHEREQRLRLLDERQMIAHDLHDGTIQTLYAIGVRMAARRDNEALPQEARDELAVEIELINGVIAEIREYISALEQRLPSRRPDLAADLAYILRTSVPPEVDTVLNITAASLQEIPAHDVENLLYITREALSNAVRHGAPGKIAVDLRDSPSELALTIQDDGSGFNQATARTGLGTITIRTRSERIGGTLSVLSIPGMGTTVRVVLPRDPVSG